MPTSTLRYVLVLAIAATLPACVQRRMTIRSNPPGAQVYVDNQEIGRTPVSTDYIYYGRRDIRLVKDGYETLTVKQSVWAPWYEWPGLAFISENFWPFEIRDERTFEYQMQPAMVVPSQTLLARAEELRSAQVVVPVAPDTVSPPAAVWPVQPLPSTAPPQYVSPPALPENRYIPPPAILNYPPGAAPQPAPQQPGFTQPAAPVTSPIHLPGDFGGRPVPPMP
jgi:hypothetical protein